MAIRRSAVNSNFYFTLVSCPLGRTRWSHLANIKELISNYVTEVSQYVLLPYARYWIWAKYIMASLRPKGSHYTGLVLWNPSALGSSGIRVQLSQLSQLIQLNCMRPILKKYYLSCCFCFMPSFRWNGNDKHKPGARCQGQWSNVLWPVSFVTWGSSSSCHSQLV